ncbi:PREDICTED: growth arrest-specific protein 1-like [Priapulus caudatus]|uniref:Growth arrest-specific protein 1-like n=1 Tax=Priapulus caudatus TaxID=37621 RepID=A0ABM1F298_PRICU|nr:PREDICTED: growth arrest-specific protein 1-like [Priapulus caudatus]
MSGAAQTLLRLLLAATAAAAPSTAATSCIDAEKACETSMQCGNAKFNMELGCNELIYPAAGAPNVGCSMRCQRALVSLASTPEGYEWLENCDCGLNHGCRRTQEVYARVCASTFPRNATGRQPIGCLKAEWICKSNELCRHALRYHIDHCRDMIAGRQCAPTCNESIAILFRQSKAAYLQTCVCDGERPQPCERWRRNVDRLCLLISASYRATAADVVVVVAALVLVVVAQQQRWMSS